MDFYYLPKTASLILMSLCHVYFMFSHGRLYWPNCAFYGYDIVLVNGYVCLYDGSVWFCFVCISFYLVRCEKTKCKKSNHMIPKIVTVYGKHTLSSVASAQRKNNKATTTCWQQATDRPANKHKIQNIIEHENENEKCKRNCCLYSFLHPFFRAFNCLGFGLCAHHTVILSVVFASMHMCVCMSEHSVAVPKMQPYR